MDNTDDLYIHYRPREMFKIPPGNNEYPEAFTVGKPHRTYYYSNRNYDSSLYWTMLLNAGYYTEEDWSIYASTINETVAGYAILRLTDPDNLTNIILNDDREYAKQYARHNPNTPQWACDLYDLSH